MGTRGLIAVMKDGEYRVAQYFQWDSYPEGQGVGVLKFLSKEGNVEKLSKALKKCRFLDKKGQDKAFCEEYDKNAPNWSSKPDNRTPEQKRWFDTYICRNVGSKILNNIITSEDEEILLYNDISFAADSLMCEWAYIVDLDKNTFEVFEGFNKKPLASSERFYGFEYEGPREIDYAYTPIFHRKTFLLLDLPNIKDFVKAFKCDDT